MSIPIQFYASEVLVSGNKELANVLKTFFQSQLLIHLPMHINLSTLYIPQLF